MSLMKAMSTCSEEFNGTLAYGRHVLSEPEILTQEGCRGADKIWIGYHLLDGIV